MALVYTYGVTDYTGGETTGGYQVQNFGYGGRVTFASAGNITQLGAYARTASSTFNIKVAIYDTSGNLVKDGGSASLSSGTSSWVEPATFTAVSVSASDYIIMSSISDADGRYGMNTGENGTDCSEGYSTFPADPETLNLENDTGEGFGRRALFTAGGGGGGIELFRRRIEGC